MGQIRYSEQKSRLPMFAHLLAISRRRLNMRLALRLLLVMSVGLLGTASAHALVIQDMTGTTVAPADDPGWNYVSTVSQNFVYLGDGWALSAYHVGLPTGGLNFNNQSFSMVSGQQYTVKNPAGSGFSAETDLRMVRINGDPGLTPINISSLPINESGENSFPLNQREVVIIGRGPARETNQTRWNVTSVAGGADIWTESPTGNYTGYRSDSSNFVKRWGKNQIADDESLFGGPNDPDLRGNLQLTVGGSPRNIMSMVTQFDAGGLTNEAQAVSGDSGSSVFFKRNGVWELTGIVNAVLSPNGTDGQPTSIAVYGSYTTFADLSYYRSEILNIMNDHPNYSVMGDINLDGAVTGSTAGGVATGDLAAFVAGWGYNNGTGVGTVTSWKNGDLNRDGKTDYADFVLLRDTFNPAAGAGGLTLGVLFGGSVVPEPASLVSAICGLAFLAVFRRRRRC